MCASMLMYDYTKSHIQTVTVRQCADLYDYNPCELKVLADIFCYKDFFFILLYNSWLN